jgi:hypothetical protein
MKTGYIIAIFVLIIFILTVMFFPEKYGLMSSSTNGMFMQEIDRSKVISLYGGPGALGYNVVGFRFVVNVCGASDEKVMSSKSSSIMALLNIITENSPKKPFGGVIYNDKGKPLPFDYYSGEVSIDGYNAPVPNALYGIITNENPPPIYPAPYRLEDMTVGLALGVGSRNTSFVGQMGITKIAINYKKDTYGKESRMRESNFINFNYIPPFCTSANILFQSKLLSLTELQLAGFKIYDHIPWVLKVSADQKTTQYLIIDIGFYADLIYSKLSSPIKISGNVGSVDSWYINHGNPTVTIPDVVTMLLTPRDMSTRCVVVDYDTSMFTIYT